MPDTEILDADHAALVEIVHEQHDEIGRLKAGPSGDEPRSLEPGVLVQWVQAKIRRQAATTTKGGGP